MTAKRKLATGLLLCLSGLLGNILSLQIFEGFNYLFGSIPVFIALRTLGTGWAFAVAVIASSWVNVLFWHPTAMLWLSLEPLVVGWMMRRTRIANMVVCDAIYWPLVGNVLLWIFFRYVMHVPLIGTIGAMLMFWLIGINNALIAELLLMFLPLKRWMGIETGSGTVTLNRMLFSLFTVLVWAPVFIIMAINGQRISAEGKTQIQENLNHVSQVVSRIIQNHPDMEMTPQSLQNHFGWLDFGGMPYRFTVVDSEGRVTASTKPDVSSGTMYDPVGAGVKIPVTETIYRVIPKLSVKVPRWRLAQLSYFVSPIEIQGVFTLYIEIPFGPFQSRVLRQQLDSLIVLMGINLVCLVISLLLARALSRNVIRLSRITHKLPEKIHRRESAEWPESKIHEISLLIGNFESMSNALRQKFREIQEANVVLENRVQERTEDLEQTNQELIREIDRRRRAEEDSKLLEDKVRRIERMESLGRLAGGVAHDFNNLLTPIMGYADLLADLTKGDSRLEKPIRAIELASRKAASLTQQILAFSRKQVLEFETIDLNHVVEEFGKILERIIGEDIQFSISCKPNQLFIDGDVSQIHQVLMNMAANARDAMPNGGKLTIRTETVVLEDGIDAALEEIQAGAFGVIEIGDTGCGMDTETQDQIFEPFFTTKGVGKGTGLGLATVFGIIKQHHGAIQVYSEMEKGTTFRIFFPLAAEIRHSKTEPSPVHDRHGGECILVVEDSDMVRDIVNALLEKRGYQVILAASAEEGAEIVKQRYADIQLLITDIVLPDRNGMELYQEVRTIAPDLRVIFMSGYTADVLSDKNLVEDGMPVLQKPFTSDELLSHVRKALDRSAESGS